ncbi:MAG: DUF308 domain-containing protein [Candidatus Nanopelagicales bacterium]|jgi:uncharacterized membrane protein HdeD (DUF308 family)|nr:DUF308 domain-containing protein [Candidatus Nanopelagicales bacterium]
MSMPDPNSLDPAARQAVAGVAKWWWLFIVTGILWLIIGVILFQFDTQSLATLGYLVGFMLLFTGLEQFFIASAVKGWKWVWILFGVFFVLGGIWAIVNPFATAFSLATSLGLLFLLVAIFWIIEAFATKEGNPLWWLGLISGLIMLGLAFWVSQQNTVAKVFTLLTFAAVWALIHGIGDFVRAYRLKKVGALVAG